MFIQVSSVTSSSLNSVSQKTETAWSMEEDWSDQLSPVLSTTRPVSDVTSGSLLCLKRGRVCQRCPVAFVLVSSLELHLASVHGEPLPFAWWIDRSEGQVSNTATIDTDCMYFVVFNKGEESVCCVQAPSV